MDEVIKIVKTHGIINSLIPAVFTLENALFQSAPKNFGEVTPMYNNIYELNRTDLWLTQCGGEDEINRIFLSYTA